MPVPKQYTYECRDGLVSLYRLHKKVCGKEQAFGLWGVPADFVSSPLLGLFPSDDHIKLHGLFEEIVAAPGSAIYKEVIKMLETPKVNIDESDGEDSDTEESEHEDAAAAAAAVQVAGNDDTGNDDTGYVLPKKDSATPDEYDAGVRVWLAHARFKAQPLAMCVVVTYRGEDDKEHAVVVNCSGHVFKASLNPNSDIGFRHVRKGDTYIKKNKINTGANQGPLLKRFWGKQAWLRVLNDRFCKIGGDYLHHYFDHNNLLQKRVEKKPYFLEMFSDKKMYWNDGGTKTNVSNPFKVYLDQPNKSEFQKYGFHPGMPIADEGSTMFNLWRGFGVKPRAPKDPNNPCPKILYLIKEVLCNGVKENYDLYLNTLANIHRHPEIISAVKIILVSDPGVGKSAVVKKVLSPIWGPHLIVVATKKLMTSHFNSHYEAAVIVIEEECSFVGDHEYANKEKADITGEGGQMLTRKGKDTDTGAEMFVNYIGHSNNNNASNVTTKTRRKRFIHSSSKHIGDQAFVEDWIKEADNGGREEFLWYMLEGREVPENYRAGFEIQKMGLNDEAVTQMFSSFDNTVIKWFHDHLMNGTMTIGDRAFDPLVVFRPGQPTIVSKKRLMEAMAHEFKANLELKQHGRKHDFVQFPSDMLNSKMFTKTFRRLVGQHDTNYSNEKNRVLDVRWRTNTPQWWFAPSEDIRARFAEFNLKCPSYSWPEPERSVDRDLAEYHLTGIKFKKDEYTSQNEKKRQMNSRTLWSVAAGLKTHNLYSRYETWCEQHQVPLDLMKMAWEGGETSATALEETFKRQNKNEPASIKAIAMDVDKKDMLQVARCLKAISDNETWKEYVSKKEISECPDTIWLNADANGTLNDLLALVKKRPREEATKTNANKIART